MQGGLVCEGQISIECYTCIFRHIESLAELLDMPFTVQRELTERVMQELLRTHGAGTTVAQLVRLLSDDALRRTGMKKGDDPYVELKTQANDKVLKHRNSLQAMIEAADSSLTTALQLAAAANMINLGGLGPVAVTVEEALRALPSRQFSVYHFDALYERLSTAKCLLYICDNAGEVVLDQLFVEQLNRHFPQLEVTCVVRHKPIINDALMPDAMAVGLDQVANVLSSGSIYPGIFLSETTPMFQKYFTTADVIIAKGIGNFSTLSTIRDQRLFFIFAVTCRMVARMTQSEIGQLILAHNHLGTRWF